MTLNTSNIAGNNNNSFVGLTAGGDITIIIGKDLPAEVKQQKEMFNVKLKELAETMVLIDEKITTAQKPETFIPPENNQTYETTAWRKLTQALRQEVCVLFIGPEISVNSQGKSLHHEFYMQLAQENSEIEYLENEGYFSPESDDIVLPDAIDFYSFDFPKKNIVGRKILEQLAQVPFSLIISICPDDTMHKVFDDYNLSHEFLVHDGTKHEVEPMTPEKPMIYNILGNVSSINGKYIFTHENFYNYLNKVIIPAEIKKKIKDATHYLFIGFDFNKWYNRLLLFILDFEQKRGGDRRMTIGTKNVKEDIEKFIAKQFKITFVDHDYSQFIEWFTYKVKEENMLRNLNQGFLQNSVLRLKSLSAKISAEDNLDELVKIDRQVVELAKSISKFKQNISG